jgi:hypothetical protein
MEFSVSPIKVQNESGKWFIVISQMEGGYLARDVVTSDLVYMKYCDIAGSEVAESEE